GGEANAAVVPRRLGIPLLGKIEPPRGGRNHLGQPQLRVCLDGRRLDADHQVADVRLAGLQHGQSRGTVWDALDDERFDRRLLAPVLLVGLEDELDAGRLPDDAIGPESDRLPAEAVLADLLDVLLWNDPGGAGGRRRVEEQEVRPRPVEREPHAQRIDDVDRLHPVVQQLGGSALVALEGELHVVGREWIAVVELETRAELELVDEPVRALLPRLREAGRHVVAGQRLDQRVVHRVQEDERRPDARRLGRIEEYRRDRRVEGYRELPVRLALRVGRSIPSGQDEEGDESDSARERTHIESPDGGVAFATELPSRGRAAGFPRGS